MTTINWTRNDSRSLTTTATEAGLSLRIFARDGRFCLTVIDLESKGASVWDKETFFSSMRNAKAQAERIVGWKTLADSK